MKVVIHTCTGCGRESCSGKARSRSAYLRARYVCHAGRGLCARCYLRADTDGTRIDHERQTWPREVLLDEYAALRDEGYGLRDIAARLNIRYGALDRALSRAKGDPRARRPDGRVAA